MWDVIWEIRYKSSRARVFCDDSFSIVWDVIWEIRYKFFMQKLSVTICFRDLVWSSHRQCFDCLVSIQRMTYVRSRLVERRMCSWWDDSSDFISSNWERFIIWKRLKSDSDNRISSNCERLIKSDESDSSSLMRTIRESCWDEISSNLWKIKKSHQTWRICFCFSDKQSRETIFDAEKT